MKQLFRAVVLVSLIGGWAMATAAVHVIRVKDQVFPRVITKGELGYHDTFVDTRNWTLNDDRAHAALVQRLIDTNQTDLLAHTVNSNSAPVRAQLVAAVGNKLAAMDHDLLDKSKPEIKTVASEKTRMD